MDIEADEAAAAPAAPAADFLVWGGPGAGAAMGSAVDAASASLRGQGAFGSVRETATPGLLLKRYVRSADMHREALIWAHIHGRCGPHAALPYAGETAEGLLLHDGGVTLYAAAAWLRRKDAALLEYVHLLRDALVMVHRRAGVEHRDLNPLNVLARPAAGRPGFFQPALIDLTNAAVPGADRLTLPRHTPRVLRASPVIRSPEETLGMDAPAFAHDAWALGALLTWLLLGPLFGTGEGAHEGAGGGYVGTDCGSVEGWTEDEDDEDDEDERSGREGAAGEGEGEDDDDSGSERTEDHEAWPASGAGGEWGEDEEDESSTRSRSHSPSSSAASSLMDAADPFTRLVLDARKLAQFYGSPQQLKPKRRWFVALAGSLAPVQGFPGHDLVAALRARRWGRIPRSSLRCGPGPWRRLRVLASLLLSYDAEVRVAALHDDRLWAWEERKAHERSEVGRRDTERSEGVRAGLRDPAAEGGRAVPPARGPFSSEAAFAFGSFRESCPCPFGASSFGTGASAAHPNPSGPRPDFLPPPPRNRSLILARLLDDTLAGEAHPTVVRIGTLLIDALEGGGGGEPGSGPDRAAPEATPNAEPVLALYAGAVAVVACGLVGYFGNGLEAVLRPRAAARLQTLPYVAQLTRWIWQGGAAARTLDGLTSASCSAAALAGIVVRCRGPEGARFSE
jgi:hypothetical protein